MGKAGALVVGSSFVRGHFKRTGARNSSSVQLATGDVERRHVKSYKEKMREHQLILARKEVDDLTIHWESSCLKEFEEAKFQDLPYSDCEAQNSERGSGGGTPQMSPR